MTTVENDGRVTAEGLQAQHARVASLVVDLARQLRCQLPAVRVERHHPELRFDSADKPYVTPHYTIPLRKDEHDAVHVGLSRRGFRTAPSAATEAELLAWRLAVLRHHVTWLADLLYHP